MDLLGRFLFILIHLIYFLMSISDENVIERIIFSTGGLSEQYKTIESK